MKKTILAGVAALGALSAAAQAVEQPKFLTTGPSALTAVLPLP